jgi:hypothetical protein
MISIVRNYFNVNFKLGTNILCRKEIFWPLILKGFYSILYAVCFILSDIKVHLIYCIFLSREEIVVNKKVWQLSPEFCIYPTTEIRVEVHVSWGEFYVHDKMNVRNKFGYSYT